jgi:hypothetical protein
MNEQTGALQTPSDDDPLLFVRQTAEILGCDPHGVMFLYRKGKLPSEPYAWGKRILLRFRRSIAHEAKPEYRRMRDFQEKGYHGQEHTLLHASKEFGISMYLLRQATGGPEAKSDQPLVTQLLPPLAHETLDPPPTGARPWKIVREADVLQFKHAITICLREYAKLNRDRWKTITEICAALGIRVPSDLQDASQCAACWVQNRGLETRTLLRQGTGKAPTAWTATEDGRSFASLKEITRLRAVTFYDFTKFKKLLDQDLVADGAERVEQLVAQHKGRCPAATIAAELDTVGLVGKRATQAIKAAGVVATTQGIEVGRGHVVYVPATKAKLNAVAIVRALLPINAGEGLLKAREAGLSVHATYAALNKLKVPLKPKHGQPGPHVWRLPGHATESELRPRRPGRPPVRTRDRIDREAEMLKAWDQKKFGTNKAATGRAFDIDRSDATKLINDHERRRCRK